MRTFTSSWVQMARTAAKHDDLGVQAVRISTTFPRFWEASVLSPSIEQLVPRPELWRYKDDPEGFVAAYTARLEKMGPEPIIERLREISADHPGKSLVLCCFEASAADCHRNLVREWWLRSTGELLEEWAAPQRQMMMNMEAG